MNLKHYIPEATVGNYKCNLKEQLRQEKDRTTAARTKIELTDTSKIMIIIIINSWKDGRLMLQTNSWDQTVDVVSSAGCP